MEFIAKRILRGFLVTFVHLQAIERHLQMEKTAETLQPEITLYQQFLNDL